MHPIVEKHILSPDVVRLDVGAGRIAKVRRPGQFVIVRRGEGAERIPLTIADADPERGTITLVIQAVGKTTADLSELEVGDAITDVAGPLGEATELLQTGHGVCVGGGVGTAVVHPIAQGLAARGVRVTSIIGGRSSEWVIYADELAHYGDVRICTDDGSLGRHGFVTDELADMLAADGLDHVYAVGPLPMMAAVADLTRRFDVPATASLNAIMVDGTGMCGGCRVNVGGKTLYACVDGPEFGAHEVDFRLLADRLSMYRESERAAFERRRCLVPRLAEAAAEAAAAGAEGAAGGAEVAEAAAAAAAWPAAVEPPR